MTEVDGMVLGGGVVLGGGGVLGGGELVVEPGAGVEEDGVALDEVPVMTLPTSVPPSARL